MKKGLDISPFFVYIEMMKNKKKIKIIDLLKSLRRGTTCKPKIFKDRTKYNRKVKHKKKW